MHNLGHGEVVAARPHCTQCDWQPDLRGMDTFTLEDFQCPVHERYQAIARKAQGYGSTDSTAVEKQERVVSWTAHA